MKKDRPGMRLIIISTIKFILTHRKSQLWLLSRFYRKIYLLRPRPHERQKTCIFKEKLHFFRKNAFLKLAYFSSKQLKANRAEKIISMKQFNFSWKSAIFIKKSAIFILKKSWTRPKSTATTVGDLLRTGGICSYRPTR